MMEWSTNAMQQRLFLFPALYGQNFVSRPHVVWLIRVYHKTQRKYLSQFFSEFGLE